MYRGATERSYAAALVNIMATARHPCDMEGKRATRRSRQVHAHRCLYPLSIYYPRGASYKRLSQRGAEMWLHGKGILQI